VGELSVEARRRVAAAILIAVVLLVVLALTDSAFFEDPPSAEERVADTVESFFAAAAEGNFETNCDLLTEEAESVMRRQAEQLLSGGEGTLKCAQILEAVLSDSFADVEVRIRDVNISGNRARAEASLKLEGEMSTFRTILLEEDEKSGGWLISDFG
jgi:hypothetical protein